MGLDSLVEPVILLDVPPSPACLVLGLPHLVSRPGQESVLFGLGREWQDLASRSRVFRLSPVEPDALTPEAAWLGLDPSVWQIAQGPLTIAALGRTPPDRSICLHLTLAAEDGEGRLAPLTDLTDAEADEAILLLMPLQTRRLTLLPGPGLSHGLVWERGPRELRCTPFAEAAGRPASESLPEGEEEDLLRSFITDTQCILDESELNRRRRGEGLAPVAFAWPWGPGEVFQAPSLPLRRGSVLRIHSRSLRLMGLAKLFGEWHCPPSRMGSERRIDWPWLRGSLEGPDPALAVIHPIPSLQAEENLEILEALLAELMEKLISPCLSQDRPVRLTLLAPGAPYDGAAPAPRVSEVGLGLNFDSRRTAANVIPFDERALDESKAPLYPLHEAAQRAVYDPFRTAGPA